MDAGTLSYNGYTFSPRSHVRVRSEIVYDDADRTTTYNRHRITVDEIVVPNSGQADTGNTMSDIRSRLSSAGKALVLMGKGFGIDLEVNVDPSGVRDVAFGPKPRITTWEPIGHTQAALLTWECEVNLHCCEDNLLAKGVASFNYDMAFAIDERGYTTRTVSGSLTISLTRSGGNNRLIDDTADNYRNIINIAKPSNFRRESQNYTVSADKRRLDFVIVDKELDSRNGWPAGVLDITASHKLGYSMRRMGRFPNTITMQIVLSPNEPASTAWQIFAAMVEQRLNHVREQAGSQYGNPYFITDIELDEDIFGNSFSFRLGYEMYLANISAFIATSGIFLPTDNDWIAYATASNLVTNDRGIAGLGHLPSMDRITDLCDSTPVPNGGQGTAPPTYPPPTYLTAFRTPTPSALGSWWRFEATLDEVTEHRSLNYSTLGNSEFTEKDFDPIKVDADLGELNEPDVIRRIADAPPGMRWRWKGYAARVGFPIPNPGILKIGDIDLVPTGDRKIRRKDMGWHFGQRVYGMAWDIIYTVKERPALANPPLQNPAFVEDDSEA